jgi:hypothetical protein
LKNAAIKAAANDPNLSPLDFLLNLMRQRDLPLELRVTVAQQALPFAHSAMQRETSAMAERLGDSRSRAYSLANEIHVSTIVAPKPLNEFEMLKKEAISVASDTADAYIQNWTRWAIGWEEIHRGRIVDARESARELMQVGHALNDPRSTGYGLYLLTWIDLISDSYAEALEYSQQALAVAVAPFERNGASQQALAVAVAPFERNGAINAKGCALVLLRQTEEGARLLEEQRRRCFVDGDLFSSVSCDIMLPVSKIFQGKIKGGIRLIEEGILRQEKEGYRTAADWYRLNLSEVYTTWPPPRN